MPRFQLRSGHDTVLAPLLASLGALSSEFAWPNYAARLGIELWTTADWRSLGSAEGQDADADGAGWVQPLVRLLYNGKDITGRLACAKQVSGAAAAATATAEPAGSPVCTLSAFEAQVAELIAPHSSWEAACFSDKPVEAPSSEHPGGRRRRSQSDVGVGQSH